MYGSHNTTPSICQGNGTCDARVPHVCYNGADAGYLAENPWEA